MSFFDEVDEPQPAPRTPPRRRRPPPGGGRPPTDRQTIQVRRAVAATALLIAIILAVVIISSCEASARRSALRDYNSAVVALIQRSQETGSALFTALASHLSPASKQTAIAQARADADSELSSAQRLNVPSEVSAAQRHLVDVMRLRLDGITNIGSEIQPALANATSRDAINRIALEMARLYTSDVLYKDYTIPAIVGALKANGITGEPTNQSQFLPDIRWLTPTTVAAELRVPYVTPTAPGTKPAPGVHGHKLNSCSVGGTTLQTGSTNTVSASPPPTFTCSFTNTGTNPEANITVKVVVNGTSVTGQAVVASDQPGQTSTVQIPLKASPPVGTYNVSATVGRVPGETSVVRNTQTYPISFQ